MTDFLAYYTYGRLLTEADRCACDRLGQMYDWLRVRRPHDEDCVSVLSVL